jgi:hypothetical protein
MSENKDSVQSFNIEYYDSWLEVEDFTVITGKDEEDVREKFKENHMQDDRQEIRNIELAYEINKSKVEEILGES